MGVPERAACRAVEVSGTGIVGSVAAVDILFRMGRNGVGSINFISISFGPMGVNNIWANSCNCGARPDGFLRPLRL